jgi:hypothetical protein
LFKQIICLSLYHKQIKIQVMILEIECKECGGQGYFEHVECSMPASECCGGCTVTQGCEECKGTGYYDVEFDINDVKPFLESREIDWEKA